MTVRIFFLLFIPLASSSQGGMTDSLRFLFFHSKDDSISYKISNQLYDHYEEVNRDSGYFYAKQCVLLSRKNNKKLNEAYSLTRQAYQEINNGLFAEALHSLLAGFSIVQTTQNETQFWNIEPLSLEKSKRLYALSCTHHIFALLMWRTLNIEQEIHHFKEAKRLAVEINSPGRSVLGSLNLGRTYFESGKFDSAMLFENEAEEIATRSGRKKYLTSVFHFKGRINMSSGDTVSALNNYYECIRSGKEQNNLDGLARGYHELAAYHIGKGNKDSGLSYARKELEIFEILGSVAVVEYNIGTAYENLDKVYQMKGQFDSSYKYLRLAQRTNDSINRRRIKSLAEFQQLTLLEQQRLQNVEKDTVLYQNKVRTFFLLSGIAVLLLLAIIFYRNNRQKNKANMKIGQAYNNLKATQQQLIQSEKMASLGELTAGIAHEIQNPLNFVNNFSEINNELIKELKAEAISGNLEDVTALANDIQSNSEKINHHGKRADAIVKGMLQHSRTSSGQKEETNLNALAEEYLRLAYHGLKAQDRSFNTTMKTDFDESIGKINIIPQDIGRVVLNLINNAFYAVEEKKKQNQKEYEPTVSVSTKKSNGKIEIKVADNGNGIPQKVLDKIYQPFFTTKPTGQGTGLGLSISYDIVKAHGGELKLETKEGEGTTFIVELFKMDIS